MNPTTQPSTQPDVGTLGAMLDSLKGQYMAHKYCLDYSDDPTWLVHIACDVAIGMSYYTIPLALLAVVAARPDVIKSLRWALLMFAVFIWSCGTGHLVAVWVMFDPQYRIEAAVKVMTASVSIATALWIWLRGLPLVLSSPEKTEAEVLRQQLERLKYQLKVKESSDGSG